VPGCGQRRGPAVAMSPSLSLRLVATQSDTRLVALSSEGHERAFEALVLRYRRVLLRYCRGLLPSGGPAEDALQQGLLQAWLALQQGTEVREPKAWLFQIVRNVALNARRAHHDEHSELSADLPGARGVDEEIHGRVVLRGVLAAIVALPDNQRTALWRTAVEGRSHEQVAEELGLSDGAVRGLIYRARATVRAGVTALTPAPVMNWLLGSSARGGTVAVIGELTAGGGAGVAGLLLKGGAVAVTAGALVTGLTGGHAHRHHAATPRVAAVHATSRPVSHLPARSAPATGPVLVARAPAREIGSAGGSALLHGRAGAAISVGLGAERGSHAGRDRNLSATGLAVGGRGRATRSRSGVSDRAVGVTPATPGDAQPGGHSDADNPGPHTRASGDGAGGSASAPADGQPASGAGSRGSSSSPGDGSSGGHSSGAGSGQDSSGDSARVSPVVSGSSDGGGAQSGGDGPLVQSASDGNRGSGGLPGQADGGGGGGGSDGGSSANGGATGVTVTTGGGEGSPGAPPQGATGATGAGQPGS
jgi:RNA polymerase sigma factor (sigma-70 family)